MRSSTAQASARQPFVVAVATLVLAGCSVNSLSGAGESAGAGAPSVVAPSLVGRSHVGQHPAWMRLGGDADRSAGFLYVGEEYAKVISQYQIGNPHNGAPVCQIRENAFPEGMATDETGMLYTTASFVGDKLGVATFGANCGSAGPTFNDPNGIPDDPAVDGTTLYVTNLDNTGQVPATIEVYDTKGGHDPIAQVSDPSVDLGIGVAVDSHHDLFWSSTTSQSAGGQVIEFRRSGDSVAHAGVVVAAMGADYPGGVLVDRSDHLLVIDQTNKSIARYAPPYGNAAVSTIALKGTTVYCALGLHQRRLYCLDYEYGSVDAYSYPAGRYMYSFTNGIDGEDAPIGIAIQSELGLER